MDVRVRIKFSKAGEGAFISHLDLLRLMERAARRADLEVAHTQGFNPRPRIYYASALALGATSEAEYADIDLGVAVPPGEVLRRLNAVLPAAVRVTAAAEVAERSKPLMAAVNVAEYDVLVPVRPAGDGPAPERAAVEAAASRVGADGPAAGIHAVEVRGFAPPALRLRVVLRVGGAGTVRPGTVAGAVCAAAGLEAVGAPRLHRTNLYAARDGRLVTPWELV